jgi:hypothetical protein
MTADPYAVTVIVLDPSVGFGDLVDAARRSTGIADDEPVDLMDVVAEGARSPEVIA